MQSNSVIVLSSRGRAGNSHRIGWRDYVNRQQSNSRKRKAIVAKVVAGIPIVRTTTRRSNSVIPVDVSFNF